MRYFVSSIDVRLNNSISKSFVHAKAKRRQCKCAASKADEVHG